MRVLSTGVPDFPFGKTAQRVAWRIDLRWGKLRAGKPFRKSLQQSKQGVRELQNICSANLLKSLCPETLLRNTMDSRGYYSPLESSAKPESYLWETWPQHPAISSPWIVLPQPCVWFSAYLQDPSECPLPKHLANFSQPSTHLCLVAVACQSQGLLIHKGWLSKVFRNFASQLASP